MMYMQRIKVKTFKLNKNICIDEASNLENGKETDL